MAFVRYTVKLMPATGVGPVRVGFVTDFVSSPLAHAMAVYLAAWLDTNGTPAAIVGIDEQEDSNPAVPLAFVVADWNTARTTVNATGTGANITAQTGWGFSFGSGSAASLGTSVCVAERTVAGGRRNGRHYLPCVRATALTTGGAITSGALGVITTLWNAMFGAAAIGVVGGAGTYTEIVSITPRSKASFLRTRSA